MRNAFFYPGDTGIGQLAVGFTVAAGDIHGKSTRTRVTLVVAEGIGAGGVAGPSWADSAGIHLFALIDINDDHFFQWRFVVYGQLTTGIGHTGAILRTSTIVRTPAAVFAVVRPNTDTVTIATFLDDIRTTAGTLESWDSVLTTVVAGTIVLQDPLLSTLVDVNTNVLGIEFVSRFAHTYVASDNILAIFLELAALLVFIFRFAFVDVFALLCKFVTFEARFAVTGVEVWFCVRLIFAYLQWRTFVRRTVGHSAGWIIDAFVLNSCQRSMSIQTRTDVGSGARPHVASGCVFIAAVQLHVRTLVDFCARMTIPTPTVFASTLEGTHAVQAESVFVAWIHWLTLVDVCASVLVCVQETRIAKTFVVSVFVEALVFIGHSSNQRVANGSVAKTFVDILTNFVGIWQPRVSTFAVALVIAGSIFTSRIELITLIESRIFALIVILTGSWRSIRTSLRASESPAASTGALESSPIVGTNGIFVTNRICRVVALVDVCAGATDFAKTFPSLLADTLEGSFGVQTFGTLGTGIRFTFVHIYAGCLSIACKSTSAATVVGERYVNTISVEGTLMSESSVGRRTFIRVVTFLQRISSGSWDTFTLK